MPQSYESRIARIMQRVMNEFAYTQVELAQQLGLTLTSLQRYLHQQRLAPVDVIVKLSKLAGISVDRILNQDDPPLFSNSRPLAPVTISNSPGAAAGNVTQTNCEIVYGDKIGADVPITKKQADELRGLVQQVVELDKHCSLRPRTPGAIWNMVFRRLHVEEIWEIRQSDFRLAKGLLANLLEGESLPDIEPIQVEKKQERGK